MGGLDKEVLTAKAEFIVDNYLNAPELDYKNVEIARDGIKQYANYLLDHVYEHIKHGDDEHMKWLKDKCEELKKEL